METRKTTAATLAFLSLSLVFISAPIFSTNQGTLTLRTLGIFLAAHFGVRWWALRQYGVRRGTLLPRFGARLAAWGALVLPMWFAGVFRETPLSIPLLVLVAVDLLMCTLARGPTPEQDDPAPAPRLHVTLRASLALALAGGAVAFHFLVAANLAYGRLLEWALASLIACLTLWYLLRHGPKGREGLPPRYRVHKPRSVPIADPLTQPLEKAVRQFLKDGDSSGLLQVTDGITKAYDLPPAAQSRVRAEVLAALARSGTSREDDLRHAMHALHRALDIPLTPVSPPNPRS